ncbi:response regulator transcription factor [Muricomes sp. OA1]|uniref:Stage 0 sporulation protein A homolog n=1 Tax=Hungatella hathewayi TaxID=154046 RepID=A0A3E2WDM7_9FIRM|nr:MULTISPECIES: response regulator transcription factor [Clostridia]MEE0200527.1 response regulator transcription factor [Muricomes sp.]MCH1974799.1 response regulator transcription factor [Muricomes sp. OA1]MRM90998.1 DNA-binding response regulator [Faecalicatena contorta]RGC23424.1 DNA-binding response regulator [Hungatella hathewayi]GKH33580.1 DNA-binding response regulator [Faecalicatena contorta]
MADILIVEDDKSINELIRRTVRMTGHRGLPVHDGREALKAVDQKVPDLILLDMNLPDISGFELLKQWKQIPVICVTARGEIEDRVRGLNGGAEDYIVKPFAVEELVARIQAALRRQHKEQTYYRLGSVEVDTAKAAARKDGIPVELTTREYELLKVLLENKNIALSRDRLLDLAWGIDYCGDDRTVDVHIRRLRQKLGMEDYIRTIFKYGYRLEI